LLRATPWGLNVFLFVGALAAAMLMLVLRRKSELWTNRPLICTARCCFSPQCSSGAIRRN
jgi:hypothetical protein